MVSPVAACATVLTSAGTPAPMVAAATPATPRRLSAVEVRDMHCPFMTVTGGLLPPAREPRPLCLGLPVSCVALLPLRGHLISVSPDASSRDLPNHGR